MIITKNNFEKEVLKSEKTVVVDFYADWCGPCKMLTPVMNELDKEYNGKVKIGKVNVDEDQELAMSFEVMSIPTVIIFKNGIVKEQMIGFSGKDYLKNTIDKYL